MIFGFKAAVAGGGFGTLGASAFVVVFVGIGAVGEELVVGSGGVAGVGAVAILVVGVALRLDGVIRARFVLHAEAASVRSNFNFSCHLLLSATFVSQPRSLRRTIELQN